MYQSQALRNPASIILGIRDGPMHLIENRLTRPYINGVCTCGVGGSPSVSTEDRHSMFCKLYKCYSYEASCCEGIEGRVIAPRSKDDPTMIRWWDRDCIEYAFDPVYVLRSWRRACRITHSEGTPSHTGPQG